MKEERAKKVLQEQIDKYGQEYDEEGIEALEIAIKALEQQPCDDCVSRQAAIEVLYDKYYDNAIAHDIVGMLFDLPSIKPQPKTGHWEYGYAFPDGQYCRCSECEELIKCIYPMHYCPNCGAKMAESEEEE